MDGDRSSLGPCWQVKANDWWDHTLAKEGTEMTVRWADNKGIGWSKLRRKWWKNTFNRNSCHYCLICLILFKMLHNHHLERAQKYLFISLEQRHAFFVLCGKFYIPIITKKFCCCKESYWYHIESYWFFTVAGQEQDQFVSEAFTRMLIITLADKSCFQEDLF